MLSVDCGGVRAGPQSRARSAPLYISTSVWLGFPFQGCVGLKAATRVQRSPEQKLGIAARRGDLLVALRARAAAPVASALSARAGEISIDHIYYMDRSRDIDRPRA